jgi:hypothetical protein
MEKLKLSTAAAVILFILGCSSQSADLASAPVPPAKTVFEPLAQQVESARGAQKTADANAQSTLKAVENQEHSDRPERGDGP